MRSRVVAGGILTAAVVLLALLGPLLAPHGENEIVARPYAGAGVLGADYLGQDVWSRFLNGGLPVLTMAVLGAGLGMLIGIALGLLAGYARGWLDETLMRLTDVVLAFPQIVLALVLLSSVGAQAWLIVLVVGVGHAPRVARLTRGMAAALSVQEFVQAAEAIGERRRRILFGELLPNMAGPLLAEAGLRLTYSIGLVASIGFLGFVADPRAADWGMMINENRMALLVQPWAILAPVLAIAVLTIGTNLIADGLRHE